MVGPTGVLLELPEGTVPLPEGPADEVCGPPVPVMVEKVEVMVLVVGGHDDDNDDVDEVVEAEPVDEAVLLEAV